LISHLISVKKTYDKLKNNSPGSHKLICLLSYNKCSTRINGVRFTSSIDSERWSSLEKTIY